MTTVTYPEEWEEIRRLAASSDFQSIMKYADYKETDPARIDPDEEPCFTYEYDVQEFAISALARFSEETVSQLLVRKFNEYEDEEQKCDVLESLAQHGTKTAQDFLENTLKDGNPQFQEAIVNGLDEASSAVSGDMLEWLKSAVQNDGIDAGLKGDIQGIIARSDKQAAAEMINKEFRILAQAGILNVDQSGLLQNLVDAAICAGHQIDLAILDQLLTNDGSESNATSVARLVNSYPDSEAKQKFIEGLQQDFFDYDGMMGELGLGLE